VSTNREIFPAKPLNAAVFVAFNFLSDLAEGEALNSATVSLTVFSGTDGNPSAMLSGSDSIVDSVVSQLLINGTVGVIYVVQCSALTNLGQTLIKTGMLAVIADALGVF